MNKEIFSKEERVLEEVRAVIKEEALRGVVANPVFSSLISEYEKLFRHSRRLVSMGDRMQQTLSRLNQELALNEQKYRGIFENVTEGIYRCDPNGILVEANPAMAEMFGFSSAADFLASVQSLQQLFCDHDDFKQYEELLASEDVCRYQAKMNGSGGGLLWAEMSASVVHEHGDGLSCSGVVGVLADVTERKYMIEKMCRLARTDSLTGLWNRGYFMELARRELVRAHRNNEDLALLMIDVDHFKVVNDTYGHDIGDKALIHLAKILSKTVREIDVVGRFGGEEFIVLLPGTVRKDACCVARRITSELRETLIDAPGGGFVMTVSIGLISLERHDDDLDNLFKYADIALYAAKKNGRDRVEVYQRSACPHREQGSASPGCQNKGKTL